MSSEFDIIEKYFSFSKPTHNIPITVGDDCAVFSIGPRESHIATSADLLIEGQHFFSDVEPYRLGHKSLAVNLSDLAAMGAKPIGCLLSLALPSVDEQWVSDFANGFKALSLKYGCPLLGGDMSKSPKVKVINVTIFGRVTDRGVRSPRNFLTRAGARHADDIWVSGELGSASLAYKSKAGLLDELYSNSIYELGREALEMPEPRLNLGRAIYPYANSCIDISDGLLQDLGHIMKSSNKIAHIEIESIPFNKNISKFVDYEHLREAMLSGGDDYELCFTAPARHREKIESISTRLGLKLTRIGMVCAQEVDGILGPKGSKPSLLSKPANHGHLDELASLNKDSALVQVFQDGQLIEVDYKGFQHF